MSERTAYDWIDDIERMQGGPNGPTIRLRACVLEMEGAAAEAETAYDFTGQEYTQADLDAARRAAKLEEREFCACYVMQQADLCPEDSMTRATLESCAGVLRLGLVTWA